jgi:hypothetical protein
VDPIGELWHGGIIQWAVGGEQWAVSSGR